MKCRIVFMVISFCAVLTSVFGVELDYLYKKNIRGPQNAYERRMISHTKMSYERAIRLKSNLTGENFTEGKPGRDPNNFNYQILKDLSSKAYYHLLNNLCKLEGASHLHIGLLAGDSFIAALYGNQSILNNQIGIDWFKECSEEVFRENCKKYINFEQCIILNRACFDFDVSDLGPIDIYLYDADHSLMGHERAITYYYDVFSDVFIVVIDDWECPWIRKSTFKAFDKLHSYILYQAVISGPEAYRGGQYVAVIRK